MNYIYYIYDYFFTNDTEEESFITYVSDTFYKTYYDYNDQYITYYEEDY